MAENNNTKKIIITIATIWVVTHCVAHVTVKRVKQKRLARKEQEMRVNDSLRNTIEYQKALESYELLSKEQKQLLQKEEETVR